MARERQQLEETGSEAPYQAAGMAHKLLQMSLGAILLAQDELVAVVNRIESVASDLVERGERLENSGREQLDEMMERRHQQARDMAGRAETTLDDYSESVLRRANIPTAGDVEALGEQVDALGRKVDRLRKEQEKLARVPA